MQNRKRDTDLQNSHLDSVGQGEGGMFQENKKLYLIPGFLSLNATGILGQIILCYGELSCMLQDVWQHSWFLPISQHQQHPNSQIWDNEYVSVSANIPYDTKSPLVENRYLMAIILRLYNRKHEFINKSINKYKAVMNELGKISSRKL